MRTSFVPFFFAILLASCTFPMTGNPVSGSGSSLSSSESAVTLNVSYVGTVADASREQALLGAAQTLVIDDSTTVLLASSDANLNLATYRGKKVEVRGSVQALEPSGSLMSVEEITVLAGADESASSVSSVSSSAQTSIFCGGIAAFPCPNGMTCTDNLADDCDPNAGGADCGGVCVPVAASSAPASSSISSVEASSSSSKAAVSSSTAAPSSASSSVASVDTSDRQKEIETMAKQNYTTASLWSQQYCTSHIAYCVAVHKNWYFKSFGATTTSLWHVEFGMSPVDALGQGVITMSLIAGPSARSGYVSGQLKETGTEVVAAFDWKSDHFEIRSDASLRAAVSYMLSSIKSYTPGE